MLLFVIFVCMPVSRMPHIPFVYSVLERRIESLYCVIVSILLLTPVHGEVILRWKGQRSRWRNENSKIVFAHMSSRKVERFIQATLYRHSVPNYSVCLYVASFDRYCRFFAPKSSFSIHNPISAGIFVNDPLEVGWGFAIR